MSIEEQANKLVEKYEGSILYFDELDQAWLERNNLMDEWNGILFICVGCGWWFHRDDESEKEKNCCTGCED